MANSVAFKKPLPGATKRLVQLRVANLRSIIQEQNPIKQRL
jgi:hypothetical protein